jgi:hypothetical protein
LHSTLVFIAREKAALWMVIHHNEKDVGRIFVCIAAPKQLFFFFLLAAGRLFKVINWFIDFRWHFRIQSLR